MSPQPVGPPPAAGRDPEAVPTTVEEVVRQRLAAALGGWRGLLDSALPALAFLVPWVLTSDLWVALGCSAAVLLVALVVRIARRETLQHALTGLVAIGIAAFIASRTGRAQDVFLPGILLNGAFAVAFTVSMVVRWPIVGFMVGAAVEDPTGWRRDRGVVRLCQKLTALLLAGYVIRFVVQLPLYLAEETTWLAVSKLVLGWPLLLAGIGIAGLVLLKGRTPFEHADPVLGRPAEDRA
ncbi:DUF3159 domain-containing protein [Kineococcus gynurae]|uniref:DUF3159 domain-containing protein n=1 Tax=Kineococcus gynurae TaxID=452979 RepID=A0ABV5LV07_9ACTN